MEIRKEARAIKLKQCRWLGHSRTMPGESDLKSLLETATKSKSLTKVSGGVTFKAS